MLRVTVTRESANEIVPIGEVVIGKFAGTEARGGYAARVLEPPSQYSEGTDACFTIRGHERYQPAMALVASVLAAWREGRIDEVGEGLRNALRNTARPQPRTWEPAGRTIENLEASLARVVADGGPQAGAAKVATELLRNALALAESLTKSG